MHRLVVADTAVVTRLSGAIGHKAGLKCVHPILPQPLGLHPGVDVLPGKELVGLATTLVVKRRIHARILERLNPGLFTEVFLPTI